MKKRDFKGSVLAGMITGFYGAVVFIHVFFPHSRVNEFLSSKIFLAQFYSFLAQFYSFPVLFGGVLSFVACFFLLLGFVRRKKGDRKNWGTKFWSGILTFSLLFLFGGTDFAKKGEGSISGETFKLVEWNTLNGLNENHVEEIFGRYHADVAVFPEFGGVEKGGSVEERLRALFRKVHLNLDEYDVFQSMEVAGSIAPVTVVVRREFGRYKEVVGGRMTTFGTVVLEGEEKSLPKLVGIHTAPPLPGLMERWRSDLEFIRREFLVGDSETIVMGDFNATTRQGAMGRMDSHEDGMTALGKWERGTWHVGLPACFRATIDHLLLPKGKYVVKEVKVKAFDQSDHGCVFMEVGRRRGEA